MKGCCRSFCCGLFCCTCCRKNPLNTATEETRLLPKNERTRNELEIEELYVFGSAPEELRKILLETYGHKPIKKIVCGRSHCLLLFNNNNIYGFGSNEEGQLGLETEKICNKLTKLEIKIQGENFENAEILDIAAGDEFSLILLKTIQEEIKLIRFGSDIKCKYATIPEQKNQKVETLPEEVNNISHIYAFEERIVFYTPSNDIYVGGMDFTDTEIDEYVLLSKFPTNIVSLHLQKESCIILDSNNQIYGLGDNSYRELGIGRNFTLNSFNKLSFRFPKSPIKKISVGARHSLFLLENGELYCIGDNSEGQCSGATSSIGFPIKVELNNKEKIIDCYSGYNHNLIILQNGSVYTWGNTTNGKLGYYEDKFSQETPREILGMKIKCINNVCLGYQLTVIATGQEQDSIVFQNKQNNNNNVNVGMNENQE